MYLYPVNQLFCIWAIHEISIEDLGVFEEDFERPTTIGDTDICVHEWDVTQVIDSVGLEG